MIKYYFAVLRPKQWIKNFFIFAALFFAQKASTIKLLMVSISAFFLFCVLTSAVYIFNDIIDRDRDRLHPQKANRPIASGKISVRRAFVLAVWLTLFSLICSFFFNGKFTLVCLMYFILNIFYSHFLKRVVIVDVFCVALGFVLRVIAGSVVTEINISSWLIICTMMISLFLGFTKRRHELFILDDTAGLHRPILGEYSTYFLDQIVSVVTTTTLIAYILYTVSPETTEKFNTTHLLYTSIFVLYGIFRYLYLVYKKEQGGNPAVTLLTDCPLLINVVLWIISVGVILYF